MGYIYKIENMISNKVYIGQTVKTLEKRFFQHKNNYNKPYFSQLSLYQAFKKYGIENFSFSQIEEVDSNQLDEREKYWIEYYNSYKDGYNSTLGGRLVELYKWDTEEIIQLYHELKSARKVAEKMKCDHSTIDNILNANQVERYTKAQQVSQKIIIKNENLELSFNTSTEVAQWFIDNNITMTKDLKNIRRSITERIRNNQKYFNYELSYENKR
jgi:group I intron endonuclease